MGVAGTDRTVMMIDVALAVAGDAQLKLEVNWQSILSPWSKPASPYVLPLPPTTTLFFFHTYVGALPPFTGVAMKVTGVPAQSVVPGFAKTVTDGVTVPLIET